MLAEFASHSDCGARGAGTRNQLCPAAALVALAVGRDSGVVSAALSNIPAGVLEVALAAVILSCVRGPPRHRDARQPPLRRRASFGAFPWPRSAAAPSSPLVRYDDFAQSRGGLSRLHDPKGP